MIIEGVVAPPPNTSATDSNTYRALMGKTQELIVSELHGKYFTQNYRQNLWMAALTSAAAIPVAATNATPVFCIWNPTGNSKAVSLRKVQYGYVSGTPAAGAIGYSYVPNAGSALGTAAPMSAFTTLTVRSCILGGPAYSGLVQAGSAATVTGTGLSAAIQARWSGISEGVLASASVPPGMVMVEDFDGDMIIPPGVMWYPSASAATTATFMISAVWEEIPWP